VGGGPGGGAGPGADGAAAALRGGAPGYLLLCHGGIEPGFDPSPFMRAGEAAQRAAVGSGALPSRAVSQYALVHGFFRGDWAAALPRRLGDAIPPPLRGRLRNVGRRPIVLRNASFAAAVVGADGGAAPAAPSAGGGVFLPPVTANPAWGGAEWPLPPTASDPNNGFMWNDFYVHDEEAVLFEREGRGLAFGRGLTEEWLGGGGVAGVLRAHQHGNHKALGPMLAEILANRPPGVFDNWRGSGLVLTFLSGAWVPGQEAPHDAYGVLRLPAGGPPAWRLDMCFNAVGKPERRRVEKAAGDAAGDAAGGDGCDDGGSDDDDDGSDGGGGGGGVRPEPQAREPGAAAPTRRTTTRRVCSAGYSFECADSGWRANAQLLAGGI
jgi:hypothetical protein